MDLIDPLVRTLCTDIVAFSRVADLLKRNSSMQKKFLNAKCVESLPEDAM